MDEAQILRAGPQAESSNDWVPTTLVTAKSAAPAIERSTCDSAAKCTTRSVAAMRVSTRPRSRMSPTTSSTRPELSRGSRLARLPA